MPTLPTPTKTEQIANAYSIAKIELYRDPNGFAQSTLSIDCHYGLLKDDTDKVTGYNLFDRFTSGSVINISLSNLRDQLTKAIENNLITEEQMIDHLTALLIMDAQLIALAQQALDLYTQANICNFPDKVTRLV